MPPPLSSPVGAEALCAPPSRRQRSSSFPRPTCSHGHRCSRLTRQHGDEQSGLVTLTFGLLTLKVVSESRVTWPTSVPILVFLGLYYYYYHYHHHHHHHHRNHYHHYYYYYYKSRLLIIVTLH